MATTTNTREFRFVHYGSTFESPNRETISCDGRVEGTSLELTHWTNNKTPDALYADTSTEMALKFALLDDSKFEDALILNNHYDSDGVLSVWACLEPERALKYSSLLKEGAEAGDFGEWSSDNGVKLDCAIESYLVNDEEAAYESVLKELPNILQDLIDSGGESYKELCKDGFQAALEDWEAIQAGEASLKKGPGKMVLVEESDGHHLSPYALHRGLIDSRLSEGVTRVLRCLSFNDDKTYRYRYEMPGYGWVKKLVDRPVIPAVDGSKLVQKLGDDWTPSGSLTGICHTTRTIEMQPKDVASLLHTLDGGSR